MPPTKSFKELKASWSTWINQDTIILWSHYKIHSCIFRGVVLKEPKKVFKKVFDKYWCKCAKLRPLFWQKMCWRSVQKNIWQLYLVNSRQTVLSKCLTNALIIGMQQFHQWSWRPLTVDEFSRRFVKGQLTQHASSHSLYIVHRGVEQLKGKRK